MRVGMLALAVCGSALAAAAAGQDAPPVVSAGSRVAIEYTLRLDDGTLADSNVGGEPLVVVQGSGTLLPGLERALDGMAVGETRSGTLEPAEAYGAVEADLFQEVDAERIPEHDRHVGAKLLYRDGSGAPRLVRVHEIRGDRIVVDMNHPYAGSAVRYELRVLRIE